MHRASTPERVFFVSRRDLLLRNYPLAEPVVLIDTALAHRYVGVRELEVLDDPAGAPGDVLPVFAINQREALLYDAARPAVIVRDLRGAASEDQDEALALAG
jgi:hypothetical protein